MKEKIILYNFHGFTKGKENERSIMNDNLNLYAENLEDLIDKIKLFNKVACFECWTSLTFYKWEITLVDNMEIGKSILEVIHFPKIISAHKIEVWGKTYEI